MAARAAGAAGAAGAGAAAAAPALVPAEEAVAGRPVALAALLAAGAAGASAAPAAAPALVPAGGASAASQTGDYVGPAASDASSAPGSGGGAPGGGGVGGMGGFVGGRSDLMSSAAGAAISNLSSGSASGGSGGSGGNKSTPPMTPEQLHNKYGLSTGSSKPTTTPAIRNGLKGALDAMVGLAVAGGVPTAEIATAVGAAAPSGAASDVPSVIVITDPNGVFTNTTGTIPPIVKIGPAADDRFDNPLISYLKAKKELLGVTAIFDKDKYHRKLHETINPYVAKLGTSKTVASGLKPKTHIVEKFIEVIDKFIAGFEILRSRLPTLSGVLTDKFLTEIFADAVKAAIGFNDLYLHHATAELASGARTLVAEEAAEANDDMMYGVIRAPISGDASPLIMAGRMGAAGGSFRGSGLGGVGGGGSMSLLGTGGGGGGAGAAAAAAGSGVSSLAANLARLRARGGASGGGGGGGNLGAAPAGDADGLDSLIAGGGGGENLAAAAAAMPAGGAGAAAGDPITSLLVPPENIEKFNANWSNVEDILGSKLAVTIPILKGVINNNMNFANPTESRIPYTQQERRNLAKQLKDRLIELRLSTNRNELDDDIKGLYPGDAVSQNHKKGEILQFINDTIVLLEFIINVRTIQGGRGRRHTRRRRAHRGRRTTKTQLRLH